MLNNDEKDKFEQVLNGELTYLNGLWDLIKRNNLENEQFVLDWLDKLNEISVKN